MRGRAGGRADRGERVLAHVRGRFGSTDVVESVWDDGRPVRVLMVDGSMQSATYTDRAWCDPVFEYYVLFDLMFEVIPTVRDVLMLGGGGFGYPKYLLSRHPEVSLTVVEADRAVIRLARRYFYLGRLRRQRLLGHLPGPRVVCGDALGFLERSKGGRTGAEGRYDAILNDCFSAGEAVPSLATPHAARLYLERLSPGGAFLANVISPLEGPGATHLHELAETLRDAGFRRVFAVASRPVVPGHEEDPDNVMLVACKSEAELPWARRLA